MSNKKNLKISKSQLDALIDVIDTLESQIGCLSTEFNKEQSRNIRKLDRMLGANGIKRKHFND